MKKIFLVLVLMSVGISGAWADTDNTKNSQFNEKSELEIIKQEKIEQKQVTTETEISKSNKILCCQTATECLVTEDYEQVTFSVTKCGPDCAFAMSFAMVVLSHEIDYFLNE